MCQIALNAILSFCFIIWFSYSLLSCVCFASGSLDIIHIHTVVHYVDLSFITEFLSLMLVLKSFLILFFLNFTRR